jgi:hypothetical protein
MPRFSPHGMAVINGHHVIIGKPHAITPAQAGHHCQLPDCRRYGLIACTPDGRVDLSEATLAVPAIGWSCQLTTLEEPATPDTDRFPTLGHTIDYTTPDGSGNVVATRREYDYTVATTVQGQRDAIRCGTFPDQDQALAAARRWALEVKAAAHARITAAAAATTPADPKPQTQEPLRLGDLAVHRPVAPPRKGTTNKISPAQRRAIRTRYEMTVPGVPIIIDRGRGAGCLTIKGLAALVARGFAEMPADHPGPGTTGLTHVTITRTGLQAAGITTTTGTAIAA